MQTSTIPVRSALLAAWGSAWLAGEAGLPELLQRVCAHDDRHGVTGLEPSGPMGLDRAVARLRARGVVRLRVVLPAPGDVLGLPGPGPFTAAAVEAGEAVLALRPDGLGTGLVPALTAHGSAFDGIVTTVLWSAYDVVLDRPDPGPFLPDAEHDLRRGVVDAARLLVDLDVARWRPELSGALADLRRQARDGLSDDDLPAGFPVRARTLLVQARQLGAVVELALRDHGGAVDTAQTQVRERALHDLAHLVRRAQQAAYNSYGLP